MRKIIRGKELGEPVVLWGNGHQRRELVHLQDFVNTLLTLVPDIDNELINLGAGEDYSIREFARAICGIVNYDEKRIDYDESRYVGAISKCLNIQKLRSRLPSYRTMPLEDGLRSCIEWFYATRSYLP